jgi:hypothetical protein
MERRQKSLRVTLKPLFLYYDDLVEIIHCLKEVSSEISINTEEYSLSDIKEIKEINRKVINSIVISSCKPYISVDLDKNSASIYISEDNALQRGVLEKIRQILAKKTRKLAWLANSSFLSGGTTGASFWFLFNAAIQRNFDLAIQGLLVLTLGLFWVVLGFKNQLKNYSMIYIQSKDEAPSFFSRKKDDIFVALISGCIGALVTYLLTRKT